MQIAKSLFFFFFKFHSALMHWKVFLPHFEEDVFIQIEELKGGVIA